MEYKKEFIVKGRYGIHVGPNCKIAMLVLDKVTELFDEGKDLEVIITKNVENNNYQERESANGAHAGELLSLCMSEGSKLEVIAKLSPENSDKRYKKELKKLVKEIGEIITNIDKYTVRLHQ